MAASAFRAPPRCFGLLAMIPIGRPSILARAVQSPIPKFGRRCYVCQDINDAAHFAHSFPIFGNLPVQQLLIHTTGVFVERDRALKI